MKPVATKIITAAIALGTAGAGLLVAGCGTRPHAHSGSAMTATITIDSDIGETFGPAPATAKPALTAQQAWTGRTHVSHRRPVIPSGVSAHLGLLTLPIGPTGPGGAETYTAHDELVYGFSWHSCPVSRNPKVRRLPRNPCVEWNFVNASTGRQIDETWQH
jgi:hypothetical protein